MDKKQFTGRLLPSSMETPGGYHGSTWKGVLLPCGLGSTSMEKLLYIEAATNQRSSNKLFSLYTFIGFPFHSYGP